MSSRRRPSSRPAVEGRGSTSTAAEAPATAGGGGGGTLVAAIGGEPDQLDPHKTTAYPASRCWRTSTTPSSSPTQNLEMEPALAESWETSEDGLTWTFTLRDGVTCARRPRVRRRRRRLLLQPDHRRGAVQRLPLRLGRGRHGARPADRRDHADRSPPPTCWRASGPSRAWRSSQQENVESGTSPASRSAPARSRSREYAPGDSLELVRNDDYWGGEVRARRRRASPSSPSRRSPCTNAAGRRGRSGPTTSRRSRSSRSQDGDEVERRDRSRAPTTGTWRSTRTARRSTTRACAGRSPTRIDREADHRGGEVRRRARSTRPPSPRTAPATTTTRPTSATSTQAQQLLARGRRRAAADDGPDGHQRVPRDRHARRR